MKPVLTAEDCVEIERAVASKIVAIKHGVYGDTFDSELQEWIAHLQTILDKIGPDGKNMVTP